MDSDLPDLLALQLIVGVLDHGGLGAAARSIGLAEPNASRCVMRFERKVGLSFVQRSPQGSSLTPEGEAIAKSARELLAGSVDLMSTIGAMRADKQSALHIAASRTIAEFLVPGWFGAIRRQLPELQLALQVLNSHEVVDQVTRGACSLGFVELLQAPRGLQSTIVGTDRLILVVPPDHKWARVERIDLEELARTPLITREEGSGTRMHLERVLRQFDPVEPALVLNSNAAVRIAVAAGVGPSVISALAVAEPLRRGEVCAVRIRGVTFKRTLRAVWGNSTKLGGVAERLVMIAQKQAVGSAA